MKAGTQAARDDAISTLREKKIQDAMNQYGLTRQAAIAHVGPISGLANKAAPTEADTAMASIEALADYRGVNKHVAIAKFLETAVGRSLYESYAEAKNEPSGGIIAKRKISNAFDALVDVFAKEHGGNRWTAANDVLKTKLGAAIYKAMAEAA
jgi:hypothetical protein